MIANPDEAGSGIPGNPRKRILLVEDDHVIQRALRDLLGSAGYELLHAYDGSDGVAQAQHASPDLILLDLGLPPSDPFTGGISDGFEVMLWLTRVMTEKKIPIIILTARDDPKSRKRGLELGASAYLTKPFKPEELLKAIRIVLEDF